MPCTSRSSENDPAAGQSVLKKFKFLECKLQLSDVLSPSKTTPDKIQADLAKYVQEVEEQMSITNALDFHVCRWLQKTWSRLQLLRLLLNASVQLLECCRLDVVTGCASRWKCAYFLSSIEIFEVNTFNNSLQTCTLFIAINLKYSVLTEW